MRFIYTISNHIITIFWRVLFLLTTFFAWTSSNIIIGDNAKFGTSTTLLTTLFVIIIIALSLGLWAYPTFRQLCRTVFMKHQLLTSSILLILVVIGQILFVTFVHPVSGFDAGMLHYAAVSKKHALETGVTAYYSLNSNNLAIMLFMHWLVVQTGQTSWQFFDYCTILFLDISVAFNLLAIANVKQKALGTGIYLHAAWLAVFPSILMPYTDVWVLPFVSLLLLSYSIILKPTVALWIKAILFCALGLSGVCIYFIKPSSIIPLVAMSIVTGLYWLITSHHFTRRGIIMTAIMGILTFGAAAGTYSVISHTINQQTYIKIDQTRTIPAIHFMAMGVYGEGGYSDKQALMMAALPTSQQKTDYSVMMLTKRLKHLGPLGYLKFLIMKQRNNTADGTFGWLKEGHFFRDNQKPKQTGIANKIKNFIYLYGTHIADFRFIAQFWWIIVLTLIAVNWRITDKMGQMLQLSIIGGFLFLLFFEGGRSRYVIQYLPCIIILATLSFDPFKTTIKSLSQHFKSN